MLFGAFCTGNLHGIPSSLHLVMRKISAGSQFRKEFIPNPNGIPQGLKSQNLGVATKFSVDDSLLNLSN